MRTREVLRHRATWAPGRTITHQSGLIFLHRPHGLELATLGLRLVVIYLLTDGQHYWRLAVRFSDWLASWTARRRGLRGAVAPR
jgi:hypothetical protein